MYYEIGQSPWQVMRKLHAVGSAAAECPHGLSNTTPGCDLGAHGSWASSAQALRKAGVPKSPAARPDAAAAVQSLASSCTSAVMTTTSRQALTVRRSQRSASSAKASSAPVLLKRDSPTDMLLADQLVNRANSASTFSRKSKVNTSTMRVGGPPVLAQVEERTSHRASSAAQQPQQPQQRDWSPVGARPRPRSGCFSCF